MNYRSTIQVVAATATSIGVLFLLDLIPLKIDVSGFTGNQIYFGMALNMAIYMFITAIVGALIARAKFVGPAIAIAVFAWVMAISFVDVVHLSKHDIDFTENDFAKLTILIVAIGSAVSGAMVGMRICKPINENDSNAA